MKRALKLLGVLLLLVGVGFGVFYFMNSRQVKEREEFNKQIEALNQQLAEIGDIYTGYTVAGKVIAGRPVEQKDLVAIKIPSSIWHDEYLQDVSTIVGKFYKVDITNGTPITKDMLMEDVMDDTSRWEDIVTQGRSVGIEVGDYVDIQMVYPYGETYTILPKVHILGIWGDTVRAVLDAKDSQLLKAAYLDQYMNAANGTYIYLSKYVEPGLQKAAAPTYAVPKNIEAIILADPNISQKIKTAINNPRRQIIDNSAFVLEEDSGAIKSGRSSFLSAINAAAQEYKKKKQDQQQSDGIDASISPNQSEIEGNSMDIPVVDSAIQDMNNNNPEEGGTP